MRVVCFVLVNFIVRVTDGVERKSVNLALETVLRFDKENYNADAAVINKVQHFLDIVKKHVESNGRRRNTEENLKLTEFIKESAKILKECNDTDLEDVFAVLDDEMRKYHYKGCKFYELVDNIDVRRYVSNQLEQAKGAPASKLRNGLEKLVITIENDTINGTDKSILELLDSLYAGANRAFRGVLDGLKKYKVQGADGMDLPKFLSTSLRTLLFDHYSNLNDNARSQVKSAINSYWNQSNDNVRYNSMKDDEHTGLRMIDVDNFKNKEMHSWSSFIMKITDPTHRPILRDTERYNVKPKDNMDLIQQIMGYNVQPKENTESKQNIMGYNAQLKDNAELIQDIMGNNVQPKENMELKQKRFKITGTSKITEKPITTVAVDLSTKFVFDDHDYIASKSEENETELKTKGKGKKKGLRIPSQDEGELFLNPKEFTRLSANTDNSRVRTNKKEKKIKNKSPEKVDDIHSESLKIEFINKKNVRNHAADRIRSKTTTEATLEIIEREPYKNAVKTDRVKLQKKILPVNTGTQVTNYYGQAVNPNDGFSSEELEYGGMKQDTLSLENNLSIETKAKETAGVHSDSIGLLVGGQKIESMNYRSNKLNVRQNENKDKKTFKIEPHLRYKEDNDQKQKKMSPHVRHKEKHGEEQKKEKHYIQNKENNNLESKKIERYLRNKEKKDGKRNKPEPHRHKMKEHVEPEEIESFVRHKAKKHEKPVNVEKNIRHTVKKDKEPVEEIFAEHSAVINVQMPILRIEKLTTSETTEGVRNKKGTHKSTTAKEHLRKNKKASRKQQKSHKSKSKNDIYARKAFNDFNEVQSMDIDNNNTLADFLNRKDVFRSQSNGTELKMQNLFSKLESQLKSVQNQINIFSQPELDEINNNNQVRASEAPITTLPSPTVETTRIIAGPTIEAKIVTTSEVKLVNPIVTGVITENTATSTTATKPAPVFRSQNNDNLSNNIVLREIPDNTVPPVRQNPIQNSNVTSSKTKADNLTSGLLGSDIIDFNAMFPKNPQLPLNDDLKNIQSLPGPQMRSDPVEASPSGNENAKKEKGKLNEQLRSMILENLNKIQELPPVPAATEIHIKVTTEPVTLDSEMEDLKRQWDSLKSNMAPFEDSPTTATEGATQFEEDDGLKALQDLQINK